ncbi:MAG: nitroreductase family protein [Elainellaceae cyanobacterium]
MTLSAEERRSTPLDVPTAINERRSIKSFTSDPIADDLLKQLVDLTIAAPSSWNLQDWRIILVQDEEKKKALCEAAFNQEMITQAPVTFVFAADPYAWKDEETMEQIYSQAMENGAWNEGTVGYFKKAIPQFQENLGAKNREYAVKDAIIAATQLTLAAESLGLSTCFMNGWVEDKVKAVIGAQNTDLAIAVVVPVGYKAEPRDNPGRLPYEKNIFVDTIATAYQG